MTRKPQTDVISGRENDSYIHREGERRFLYDDGSAVSARSAEEKRAPERDATATCETLIKSGSSCILRCHVSVMTLTISQNLLILISSLTTRRDRCDRGGDDPEKRRRAKFRSSTTSRGNIHGNMYRARLKGSGQVW